MTKNERINHLESIVKNLANILGYTVAKDSWYLSNAGYSPTIHEILRVLYDKVGIETINLGSPPRRIVNVILKEEAKNAKRQKPRVT